MGHELRQRLGQRFLVLVDVDDDVARAERPDFLQIDVLGAADLRNAAHGAARMYAETGPPDQPVGEAEIADQFGDGGHQRDDARVLAGRRVQGSEGVAQHHGYNGRSRDLRGARAVSRSNSHAGSARMASETSAICQGITTTRRFAAMARATRRAASSAESTNGMR